MAINRQIISKQMIEWYIIESTLKKLFWLEILEMVKTLIHTDQEKQIRGVSIIKLLYWNSLRFDHMGKKMMDYNVE